jgi:hypothetical protein
VAIFLSLRFLPQGTSASPSVKINPAVLSPEQNTAESPSMEQGSKKVNRLSQNFSLWNSCLKFTKTARIMTIWTD